MKKYHSSHLLKSNAPAPIAFLSRFFMMVIWFVAMPCSDASIRSEAVETTIKAIGHSLPDAGKVALRKSLKEASLKYGDDVFKAAQRGGVDFVEAATRHGDDIWRLAKLSPKAPKALAAHPEELVRLSRKFGDDAVRLEIKAPGCGEILAKKLPKKAMREVAEKAGPSEVKRLAAMAIHGKPSELKATYNIWKSSKSSRFLKVFTPARIAASGLAVALVTATLQAPEATTAVAKELLTGVLGPVMAISSWLLVLGLLILLRTPVFWLIKKLFGPFRKSQKLA